MENNYLIIALVFFPFAAGIVSYIIGRFHKNARDLFYILLWHWNWQAQDVYSPQGSADSSFGKDLPHWGYTLKLTDSA
ncbi:MAG: hypothetical protein ACLSCV_01025 [Acutalibacteraceae bacterium]